MAYHFIERIMMKRNIPILSEIYLKPVSRFLDAGR